MTPTPTFSTDATAFFSDLTTDNSRSFWAANKPRFEREVATPMRELTEGLAPVFGPFKTFRMHRDVRFSADKSPYKTMHGAAATTDGGSVYYLHLDAEGVQVASGAYAFARDQLARFREALLDDDAGAAFADAISQTEHAGTAVTSGGPDPLKRAPRGVDPEHPRIEWLRWKGAAAMARIGIAEATFETIAARWTAAQPLVVWLDAHVGPSTESRF